MLSMRAAIYTRISSDSEGTGLGVARQEEDCRELAARRGWTVVEVFKDNDVSATRSKVRPAYQRMLDAVREGRVQAIIVWNIDRLTRSPREMEDVIDFAETHGLQLANVNGADDLSTADGRAMARIKGAFAKAETDKMSLRLRRSFQQKAEMGKPHGRAPYGYENVEGTHVVVPEQASVIREVAARVLNGESLYSIATDLNEQGVSTPSREGEWSITTLRKVVERPALAGLRYHKGVHVGALDVEPILTEDEHLRIVAIFANPARKLNMNASGPKPIHLLSGIARCGNCGAGMRVYSRASRTGKHGQEWHSNPGYGCPVCFKVKRRQAEVDEVVEAKLIAALVLGQRTPVTGHPERADETAELTARLRALDAEERDIMDNYRRKVFTAAQVAHFNSTVEAERADVNARLAATREDNARSRMAAKVARIEGNFAEPVDAWKATWESMKIEDKRALVAEVLTITLPSVGKGNRKFDPASVLVEFR